MNDETESSTENEESAQQSKTTRNRSSKRTVTKSHQTTSRTRRKPHTLDLPSPINSSKTLESGSHAQVIQLSAGSDELRSRREQKMPYLKQMEKEYESEEETEELGDSNLESDLEEDAIEERFSPLDISKDIAERILSFHRFCEIALENEILQE